MYLKEIVLKGFKSFPERTLLQFAPGVSVVVGPNGSGKSNVTDAVLWAMGEQSPLAVRGQSMQDVLFAGSAGRQAARSAEVELIFDNSDGSLPYPSAEVSVKRSLDRSGEGEYRLNGARCRLTDVLEILSDSGLGKEGHSVIGQGRVEQIVTSKPRDRRLLIEEAAGLGKHRRRRRRAQVKLDRTRENLDRALDVEREARSRLKPLKRQAQAAEIHERLERQSLEARLALARDDLRERVDALGMAEEGGAGARAERDRIAGEAKAIAAKRLEAEEALAGLARQRDDLASRTYAVRAACDRLDERHAGAVAAGETLAAMIFQAEQELAQAKAVGADDEANRQLVRRREELSAELKRLDDELASERAGDMAGLEAAAVTCAEEAVEALEQLERHAAAAKVIRSRLEESRKVAAAAADSLEVARKAAARSEGELAAVEEYLRVHATGPQGASVLADGLEVEEGLELAVSAALGGRLSAAVAADRGEAARMLDAAGEDGGAALVDGAFKRNAGAGEPPATGAVPLASVVGGGGPVERIARALLADCWLVDDLGSVGGDFQGTAVTRAGRSWIGGIGELRQAAKGGSGRLLAQRNRRGALVAACDEHRSAVTAAEGAERETREALEALIAEAQACEQEQRQLQVRSDAAAEKQRRADWLVETRRDAPQAGPVAVRRAEVAAELAAEERIAARLAAEREGESNRLSHLAERLRRDRQLTPIVASLVTAIGHGADAVGALRGRLDAQLAGEGAQGEGVTRRLRDLASKEAELQAALAKAAEAVTVAEVDLQRLRDRSAESEQLVNELALALGLDGGPAGEALGDEERAATTALIDRLAKRREQLGPVNPLAQDEYRQALEHVEELEEQRGDLEAAMRELQGLIRDCDRTIKENFEQTFEAASRHFEELAAQLFPGGKGRLRLVSDEQAPSRVLGGGEEGEIAGDEQDAEESNDLAAAEGETAHYGVEIEITPAGKAMKRLTLLSGGEKSMTALAFLFAVFLARPCPFYILDEVEAALDDLNLGRFIELLRTYRSRAQFIVVTHQRRTMEAADSLYGVSMGTDGVSKVVSRKLASQTADAQRLAA